MQRTASPPPAARERPWLRWLAIALAASVPGFFLTYAQTRRLGFVIDELFDLAHVVFFYLLGAVLLLLPLLALWGPWQRAGTVLLLLLAFGISVEALQPFVGRDASWGDVRGDLAGVLIALLLHGRLPTPTLARLLGAGLLAVLATGPACLTLTDRALARLALPILSDFEQPLERGRWDGGVITQAMSRRGDASLRIDLEPGPPYPGIGRTRSFGDWRGYDALVLSLHNGRDDPVDLTLSIADAEHWRRGGAWGDRYDGTFRLAPGWNDLRVPLATILEVPSGRRQNASRIERFLLFVAGLERPVTLHLDAVALVPPTTPDLPRRE